MSVKVYLFIAELATASTNYFDIIYFFYFYLYIYIYIIFFN